MNRIDPGADLAKEPAAVTKSQCHLGFTFNTARPSSSLLNVTHSIRLESRIAGTGAASALALRRRLGAFGRVEEGRHPAPHVDDSPGAGDPATIPTLPGGR